MKVEDPVVEDPIDDYDPYKNGPRCWAHANGSGDGKVSLNSDGTTDHEVSLVQCRRGSTCGTVEWMPPGASFVEGHGTTASMP